MTFNKKILHLLVVLSILFLSLCAYLTYFQIFRSSAVISSSYNRRLWEQEDSVLRGSIQDRNGTILASSHREGEDEAQVREYPYKNLYAHVIGYNSRTYGKSRLELQLNDYLSGSAKLGEVMNIKETLTGGTKKGADVRLTIDHKLQTLASEGMGNRKGAVVALDPRTGEVLALVSKPDFDPSDAALSDRWEELSEGEDSPFLTRATGGLYNPGSTFKTVIATAAVEKGLGNVTYDDQGAVVIDGKTFKNSHDKSYGEINLSRALAVSSNVVFSQLAVRLGEDTVRDIVKRFGIGKEIPFDLAVEDSRFPYSSMGETDLAAVGIGQGKLQLTPMNMALIASAIANDGVMMKPYLVDRITAANGLSMRNATPSVLSTVCSPSVADAVTDMMEECVSSGTGTGAQVRGVSVAGKTGTAQNETDQDHAWFICFAPAENPVIAIAIVLEYDGTGGGTTAAPIARKMMEYYLAQ